MPRLSVEVDERERSALLVSQSSGGHHFAGVVEALARRGVRGTLEVGQLRAPVCVPQRMAHEAGVLVHVDGVEARAAGVLAFGRRTGRPVALLMDGVAEYANTFLNNAGGARFLRPAPADVVLAAGAHDRAILRALGNRAMATGLPRLDVFAKSVRACTPSRDGPLLVATANQVSFTAGGRARVLGSLARLRDAAAAAGVGVRWRIALDLAEELGVRVERGDLASSLARACAVVTTASTLALEAMLAGRPVAVLHPHPWPLWLPSVWVWRGEQREGMSQDLMRVRDLGGVDEAANRAAAESYALALDGGAPIEIDDASRLIEALRGVDRRDMERQACLLKRVYATNAVERVASAIDLIERQACRRSAEGVPRVAVEKRADDGAIRVVSIIEAHESSVGGVASFSERMERWFEMHPELRADWRTLYVGPTRAPAGERFEGRARAHVLQIDPTAPVPAQSAAVADALSRLGADVVLPNYGERSYAGALRWRASGGGRVVATAHTNDEVYRELLSRYGSWDGAIAVSRECLTWVRSVAGDRPTEFICYGVPLRDSGHVAPAPGGPLRLAYIGRVVERQKRVSDLIMLLEELVRMGVEHEFHLVGDGESLGEWQRGVQRRGLGAGRVFEHGAKPREWVQDFLQTIDVSVIVSDAEGTSISMLEAMAAGVLPCVTRVDDSIDQLLTEGVNAIVVPVGAMQDMARRLAEIDRDRSALRRMREEASRTIERCGLGLDRCAQRYAAFLRRVHSAEPARPLVTDSSLDMPVACVSVSDGLEATVLRRHLMDAGYGCVVEPSALSEGGDGPLRAVVIGATQEHPGEARIRALRARGVGVAVEPTLCEQGWSHVTGTFERLVSMGCRRIGLYADDGVLPSAVDWIVRHRGDLLACVLHPRAAAGATMFGVPTMTVDEALRAGAVDGVVLSARHDDPAGYAATRPLRRAGVTTLIQPGDAAQRARLDALIDQASNVLERGGVVVTTSPGLLPGTVTIDAAEIGSPASALADAPDMLILRGEERDFAAYLSCRAWRSRGTSVHSLRWPDEEIACPERFAAIVGSTELNEAYAIYGGGMHTRRLLELSPSVRRPVCVMDDGAEPGARLCGVPVVRPDDALALRARAIVLSSTRFEAALWERTEARRASGVRVIPLYMAPGMIPGAPGRLNRGVVAQM